VIKNIYLMISLIKMENHISKLPLKILLKTIHLKKFQLWY